MRECSFISFFQVLAKSHPKKSEEASVEESDDGTGEEGDSGTGEEEEIYIDDGKNGSLDEDERTAPFLDAMMICKEKFKDVKEKDLVKLGTNELKNPSKDVKCLINCIASELNIVDDEGLVISAEAIANAMDIPMDVIPVDIIDKCNKATAPDACGNTFAIVQCIFDSMKMDMENGGEGGGGDDDDEDESGPDGDGEDGDDEESGPDGDDDKSGPDGEDGGGDDGDEEEEEEEEVPDEEESEEKEEKRAKKKFRKRKRYHRFH